MPQNWSHVAEVVVTIGQESYVHLDLESAVVAHRRDVRRMLRPERERRTFRPSWLPAIATPVIPDPVFRDELGFEIPRWRIAGALCVVESRDAGVDRYFRDGTVPGISRRGRGHWCRSPRTHQESAVFSGDLVDEDVIENGAGSRSVRGRLPTGWDDIHIGRQRNWKRQRRTHWKATQ